MNKQYNNITNLAIPAIISNFTVPLLGLIDMAIVGHMGSADYIGAIAIGSMIFNSIYWLFGFLRMGTSGITAQEVGKQGNTNIIFLRSLVIGLIISVLLIVFCYPILQLCLYLMSPEEELVPLVSTYYYICIMSAPAVLIQYSLTGWFIGMQDTRKPMIIAISQNILNIFLSLAFVYGLHLKIEGVALGTMLSQWFAADLGIFYFYRKKIATHAGETATLPHSSQSRIFNSSELRRFFSVNTNIFFRTLFLMSVMFFFTSAGSKQGTDILAVNSLLMQTWLIFSYFMDGFAYAGEALCGKYYGANKQKELIQTVKALFAFGCIVAFVFTLAFIFGYEPFLSLLTDDPSVVKSSVEYQYWITIIPFFGMAAFIWDGVFIGLTFTRQMLISCFFATVIFYTLYYVCSPSMHNHGLWLAFVAFLLARGAIQTLQFFRSLIYNKK